MYTLASVREASFDLIGIRGKEAAARTRLGPSDAEDNDYYGQNRAGMRAALKFPRVQRQIDGWTARGRERERERERATARVGSLLSLIDVSQLIF